MQRAHIIAATAALAATLAPAASAVTSQPFPETGTYHGQTLPAEELTNPARGLACAVTAGSLTCHDSLAESQAASRIAELKSGSSFGLVAALSSCSPALIVWENSGFTGTSLGYNDYPGWFDLPSWFRNVTSSWQTGCRLGKLAENTGGGGAQRSWGSYSSESLPSSWNDRADSVYRG